MMEKYFERRGLGVGREVGAAVHELVALTSEAASPNAELYEQMLRDLVHFMQESPHRWDAKILGHTIRELTSAFSRLRPYQRRRKVTVYGSARTPEHDPNYALARELGALLAADDYMVITGAGGGIMQAAHEGAGTDASVGLNIALPHEQAANPVIRDDDKLISFRFFFTRKLFFVKEADAIVLCPGGFGTQDEAFELLTLVQTGKSPLVPIVLLDAPGTGYWSGWLEFVKAHMVDGGRISPTDLALFCHVHTPMEALQELRQFYRMYHSARWVEKVLYLRLLRPLSEERVAQLAREFADLCPGGTIAACDPHPAEADEPELASLPRLAFPFANRNFGRLRRLVDAINASSESG